MQTKGQLANMKETQVKRDTVAEHAMFGRQLGENYSHDDGSSGKPDCECGGKGREQTLNL